MLSIIGVGCPIRYLFDVPCPTCGVTRALCALLRLDIAGYLGYNAMALPLCIAVWFLLCADIFPQKWAVYCIGYGILAINIIYYIARLWL